MYQNKIQFEQLLTGISLKWSESLHVYVGIGQSSTQWWNHCMCTMYLSSQFLHKLHACRHIHIHLLKWDLEALWIYRYWLCISTYIMNNNKLMKILVLHHSQSLFCWHNHISSIFFYVCMLISTSICVTFTYHDMSLSIDFFYFPKINALLVNNHNVTYV